MYNVLCRNCAGEMYTDKHNSHTNNYAHLTQLNDKIPRVYISISYESVQFNDVKQPHFPLILYTRALIFYTK